MTALVEKQKPDRAAPKPQPAPAQKKVQKSSPKLRAAMDYLSANPDAREMSGRELEKIDSSISYKTWNEAKKQWKP